MTFRFEHSFGLCWNLKNEGSHRLWRLLFQGIKQNSLIAYAKMFRITLNTFLSFDIYLDCLIKNSVINYFQIETLAVFSVYIQHCHYHDHYYRFLKGIRIGYRNIWYNKQHIYLDIYIWMNHELCNEIMKTISIKVPAKFHQLKFQFNLKDIKFKICYVEYIKKKCELARYWLVRHELLR